MAELIIVYFSSKSNNTHRFVQKLGLPAQRISIDDSPVEVGVDYLLIVPTYAAGGSDAKGAVPKQVIHFLNNPTNRKHCKGSDFFWKYQFWRYLCHCRTYHFSKITGASFTPI